MCFSTVSWVALRCDALRGVAMRKPERGPIYAARPRKQQIYTVGSADSGFSIARIYTGIGQNVLRNHMHVCAANGRVK